jgi:2-methylisocitrate lyase-like PEP mutase family enzyme
MDVMSNSRPTIADKRKTFRQLHEAGCFVIPNPWNVGTARYLQSLGFKALATTSSGHAHARGCPDGAQGRDDVLAHYREMTDATDVPLNADFENGFADEPEAVSENVARCIATGVAGLSIEDSPKSDTPLYDFDTAVARIKAASAAIDRAGGDVVLTASRILTTSFAVFAPTRWPAPIASTPPVSKPASRSKRSWRRWRRSR